MISKYSIYSFIYLVILTLASTFKPIDMLPDMITYKDYFDQIKDGGFVLVDFSYIYLSKFVQLFSDSFRWVVFLYVLLSLSIKFYCFKFFENKYLILFLYSISILLLHEFIQIRIALAISFLLLGVVSYIRNGRFYYLYFFLSVFFHASAFLFLIFFVISKKFARIKFLSILFFITVFFVSSYFFNILSFFNSYLSNYIIDKVEIYINASAEFGKVVNPFSIRLIVIYLLLIFLTFRVSILSNLHFILYFCIFSLLALAVGLKNVPDISFRLIDMSILFSVILISGLRQYFNYYVYCFFVLIFIFASIHYNYKLLFFISGDMSN